MIRRAINAQNRTGQKKAANQVPHGLSA